MNSLSYDQILIITGLSLIALFVVLGIITSVILGVRGKQIRSAVAKEYGNPEKYNLGK